MARTTTGGDEALTLQEAADLLGVHYMTAYRYVRTGRLEAERQGTQWLVPRASIESIRAPSAPGRTPRGATSSRDYAGELVGLLVAGDEPEAWRLTQVALGSACTPEQLYLKVLGPALAYVGDAWADDLLSVAEEHRASALVGRLVGRLGPLFMRRGPTRGLAVLATPSGDHHALATALLADPLRGRGFRVADLGADTPASSLAELVSGEDRAIAVGLVASIDVGDDVLSATIAAIRSARPVPVLVGGHGIGGPARAAALGADAYTATARDAVRWFGTVVAP